MSLFIEPRKGETYYITTPLYAILPESNDCYLGVGDVLITAVSQDFDYPYSNWYGAVEFTREDTTYALQLYKPERFVHPVPDFLDIVSWESHISSGDIVRSSPVLLGPRATQLQDALERGWAEGIAQHTSKPREHAYTDVEMQTAYEKAHGRASGQSSFVGKPRPEKPRVVEDGDGTLRVEWDN